MKALVRVVLAGWMIGSMLGGVTAGEGEVTTAGPCPEGSTLDEFASVGVVVFEPLRAPSEPIPIEIVALSLVSAEPILVKLDEGQGLTQICRGPPQPLDTHTETHTEIQFEVCFPTREGEQCFPVTPEECQINQQQGWECRVTTSVHGVVVVDTWRIPLEMVALELRAGGGAFTSTLPVRPHFTFSRVSEHPVMRSTGEVRGARLDENGQFYGGESFFDIFYVIDLAEGGLRGTNCVVDDAGRPDPARCQPFRVRADLTPTQSRLPPHLDQDPPYQHPFGEKSVIWSEAGEPLGAILSGCHKPYQTAFPEGHRVCLVGTGVSAPEPATGGACLRNSVTLGVVDVSNPPHGIASVAAGVAGPLSLSPWTPTNVNGVEVWTSQADTPSPGCADVGVSVTATFTDGDASAPVGNAWRQRS